MIGGDPQIRHEFSSHGHALRERRSLKGEDVRPSRREALIVGHVLAGHPDSDVLGERHGPDADEPRASLVRSRASRSRPPSARMNIRSSRRSGEASLKLAPLVAPVSNMSASGSPLLPFRKCEEPPLHLLAIELRRRPRKPRRRGGPRPCETNCQAPRAHDQHVEHIGVVTLDVLIDLQRPVQILRRTIPPPSSRRRDLQVRRMSLAAQNSS